MASVTFVSSEVKSFESSLAGNIEAEVFKKKKNHLCLASSVIFGLQLNVTDSTNLSI